MYPSDVPARPKLLPRPCPQCGKETGGIQIVLFNPVYYNRQKYAGGRYDRRETYVILRISHGYSKTERTEKNNRKKITHNFRIAQKFPFELIVGEGQASRKINSDELFNEPNYVNGQSVTIRPSGEDLEYYRINGWPIETHGTHWMSKKRVALVNAESQQPTENVILSSALATLS